MAEVPAALLVDLDDTLLDGAYLRRAVAMTCEVLASQCDHLDAAQLSTANAAAWQAYWPEIGDDWILGAVPSDSVRLEVWRRSLLACGTVDGGLAALAARTHAQAERDTFELFDDAVELLAAVRGRVALGLVTNGASDIQREKLDVLGIEGEFGAVVVSGEVGCAKPDPAIFTVALESLSVAPQCAWHVGDNLHADVAGAAAAGVRPVWLNREGRRRAAGDPLPEIQVGSLRELTALLAT